MNFFLISFSGIARRKLDIDVNTISRALNKYEFEFIIKDKMI